MFLVEAVPSSENRGILVDAYCRDNGKSIVYKGIRLVKDQILNFSMKHPDDKYITHRIPTIRLKEDMARKRLEELLEEQKLKEKGIRFSIENYSKENKVIHAIGPASMKRVLPSYFMKTGKDDKVVRMLRWQIGWFPEVEECEEGLRIGNSVDLETLLNEKGAVIDFEVKGYDDEKKPEQIYLVSYFTTHAGNYILTTYDFGEKEVEFETVLGKRKVKIVGCGDQDDLIDKLNQFNSDYDPLYLYLHNAHYDLTKPKNLGSVKFTPGVDGSEPRIVARAGLYRRMHVIGRIVIDSAPFSQHYLPQTINNKLMTVASHVLGVGVSKTESYEELAKLTEEGEGRKLAEYGANDGTITLELGKRILVPIIYLSMFFKQSPEMVCVISKKRVAGNYHELKRFSDLNTHEFQMSGEEKKRFDDFSVKGFQNELIQDIKKTAVQKGLLEDKLKYSSREVLGFNRDIFEDAYLVRLVPLISAARFLTDKIDFSAMYSSAFTKRRGLVYAEALENLIERAFFELRENSWFDEKRPYSPSDVPFLTDFIFGKKYEFKITGANIYSLVQNSLENIAIVRDLLSGVNVINFSDNFVVFGDKTFSVKDVYEDLIRKELAIGLGKGRVVSVDCNRFFMLINGLVYSQGIDPSGTRGWRTINESELYRAMGEKLLEQDVDGCLDLARQNYFDIETRRVPPEKMVFSTDEVRRVYFDYSASAQQQERIRAYIEFCVKAGEKLAYGITKNGKKKVPEFLEEEYNTSYYINHLFGLVGRNGSHLISAGVLGDLLLTIKEAFNMDMQYLSSRICSLQPRMF